MTAASSLTCTRASLSSIALRLAMLIIPSLYAVPSGYGIGMVYPVGAA